jgi:hypothetical protein
MDPLLMVFKYGLVYSLRALSMNFFGVNRKINEDMRLPDLLAA